MKNKSGGKSGVTLAACKLVAGKIHEKQACIQINSCCWQETRQ